MVSRSEKNEKSLAEFIVSIALVTIMMAIFINFYIKNESQFTHTGFDAIAQSFNTKITTIHAQWMMDNQPNVVYLASLHYKEKQAIPVNSAGWVDSLQEEGICEAIWQLVMEVPIKQMNIPVSAIEIRSSLDEYKNEQQNKQLNKQKRKPVSIEVSDCRYVMFDGSYFQYNRAKGRVSKVIKAN